MLILIGNRSVWIRQEEKAESAWLHLISHINLIIGWENVDLLSPLKWSAFPFLTSKLNKDVYSSSICRRLGAFCFSFTLAYRPTKQKVHLESLWEFWCLNLCDSFEFVCERISVKDGGLVKPQKVYTKSQIWRLWSELRVDQFEPFGAKPLNSTLDFWQFTTTPCM